MFGNVRERTSDWYAQDYYANSPLVSPAGPSKGTKKIRRGGSFHCQVHLVRPAYRSADTPDTRYSVISITGSTGRYAGITGEMTSVNNNDGTFTQTLRYWINM